MALAQMKHIGIYKLNRRACFLAVWLRSQRFPGYSALLPRPNNRLVVRLISSCKLFLVCRWVIGEHQCVSALSPQIQYRGTERTEWASDRKQFGMRCSQELVIIIFYRSAGFSCGKTTSIWCIALNTVKDLKVVSVWESCLKLIQCRVSLSWHSSFVLLNCFSQFLCKSYLPFDDLKLMTM